MYKPNPPQQATIPTTPPTTSKANLYLPVLYLKIFHTHTHTNHLFSRTTVQPRTYSACTIPPKHDTATLSFQTTYTYI